MHQVNQAHLRGRFAPRKRATWPTKLAQIVTAAIVGGLFGAMLALGY